MIELEDIVAIKYENHAYKQVFISTLRPPLAKLMGSQTFGRDKYSESICPCLKELHAPRHCFLTHLATCGFQNRNPCSLDRNRKI
jgi:hypothetical protein